MTPRKRAPKRRFQEKAWAFLRWRKQEGGKVESLKGEARHCFVQTINKGNTVDGVVELDVIFERNERFGRLA